MISIAISKHNDVMDTGQSTVIIQSYASDVDVSELDFHCPTVFMISDLINGVIVPHSRIVAQYISLGSYTNDLV